MDRLEIQIFHCLTCKSTFRFKPGPSCHSMPSNSQGEEETGKNLSCLRAPWGGPHRKTHLLIPPQRGKNQTSPGQGNDVRGCRFLTVELNAQHPQKSQLSWMEDGWDSHLSQEISNPCSTADPRRSPGPLLCVTPSQTPLWQVGKAKFVRISRGFPLETEFPRNHTGREEEVSGIFVQLADGMDFPELW